MINKIIEHFIQGNKLFASSLHFKKCASYKRSLMVYFSMSWWTFMWKSACNFARSCFIIMKNLTFSLFFYVQWMYLYFWNTSIHSLSFHFYCCTHSPKWIFCSGTIIISKLMFIFPDHIFPSLYIQKSITIQRIICICNCVSLYFNTDVMCCVATNLFDSIFFGDFSMEADA
jgi:hypothetical protein